VVQHTEVGADPTYNIHMQLTIESNAGHRVREVIQYGEVSISRPIERQGSKTAMNVAGCPYRR